MTRPQWKKAIVIVEDHRPIAEIIKETLNGEPNYQAVVVHDGSEALDVIHAIQASVIILDLHLPGLSGTAVYDALQADSSTRHVPVLFVTAHPNAPEMESRGITNVIAKPFNLDELLLRVRVACGDASPPAQEPAVEAETILDARLHEPHDILYYLNLAD